jgi:hypothetical protein
MCSKVIHIVLIKNIIYTACPAEMDHAWSKFRKRSVEDKATNSIHLKIRHRFSYILYQYRSFVLNNDENKW